MRATARERFVGQRVPYVARTPRRQGYASSFSGSTLTDITSGGTAHTKGATYTTLTASAAIDADGFYLALEPASASNDFLLDIAIGAASSEVNIISNLLCCASGVSSFEGFEVYVPLPIRAGTRVSARCQATGISQTFRAGLLLCKGPQYRAMRMRRAVTYGANTADSGGLAIDPGAVADTKPATYTEVVSALTNPMRYAIICHGNVRNGARTSATTLMDIAIGAASSEIIVLNNLYVRLEAATDAVRPVVRGRFVDIERGQRLAARASCSITEATDRLTDLVVIGFD